MKPVTNEEVASAARKTCKHCRGGGVLSVWVFTDPTHQEKRQAICKCARSRFERANKDKIKQDEGGSWVWAAPTETAA